MSHQSNTEVLHPLFLDYATHLRSEKVEKLLILFLDEKLEVIAQKEITQDHTFQAEFCAHAVFAPALLHGAKNIAIIHNHPSGTVKPSSADYLTTVVLSHAALTLQITLVDHVIVTRDSYFSFRKAGIL